MPTYFHECRRCGDMFERSDSMRDLPLEGCPGCRGEVRRAAGIVLSCGQETP